MEEQQTEKGKYSPEVEEILLKRPSFLVRKGILLLAILVVLILAVSYFIKYPERLTASVSFTNPPVSESVSAKGELILTSAAASIIATGQPVVLTLQFTEEGPQIDIPGIVGKILPIGSGDYYSVSIIPDTELQLYGYSGTAYIVTGESSLLSKILNPVFAVFRTADH
ncbi:hypothetical protein ACFLS7_02775 [Bacteroidota bacterium]